MKTIDPNSYKMLRILIWHCAYRMMKPVAWVFTVMITLSLWTFFAHMPDGYIGLCIAIALISIWAFGIYKNWHSTARIYLLQEYLDMSTLYNTELPITSKPWFLVSQPMVLYVSNLKEYYAGRLEYRDGDRLLIKKSQSYLIGWFMKSRSRWA